MVGLATELNQLNSRCPATVVRLGGAHRFAGRPAACDIRLPWTSRDCGSSHRPVVHALGRQALDVGMRPPQIP
jgi:hypothetical protein